jgi:hypothetical protein
MIDNLVRHRAKEILPVGDWASMGFTESGDQEY